MRTLILALFGVWGLAAPTGDEAEVPTAIQPPTVSVSPERPVQCHLFRVRVTPAPNEQLSAVRGDAGGEVLHFTVDEGGVFEGFGPVPIETEGSLPMRLVAVHVDGREEALDVVLGVAEGEYRHERLSVAPRLGGRLNDADAARLAEDQA